MITVHHLNNSRSQRVLWLLEELGLPYEIRKYQRDAKTMLAPPELLKVHPLGKSPVITDDGVTVAESGAIIEYLLERHGDGRLEPERAVFGSSTGSIGLFICAAKVATVRRGSDGNGCASGTSFLRFS